MQTNMNLHKEGRMACSDPSLDGRTLFQISEGNLMNRVFDMFSVVLNN